MIDKAPDAYRTISEVAEDLDLPQHVLRFWETRFAQIKPLKRGGGRRYYRPDDVELLKGIRHLLYGEGYTIKGVQRILKDQGPKAVQALVVAATAAPEEMDVEPAPQPVAAPRPAAPPPQPQTPPVYARPAEPVAPPQDWQAPPVLAAPPRPVAPPVYAPQNHALDMTALEVQPHHTQAHFGYVQRPAPIPPQMVPLPPAPVIAPLAPAFPPEPVYAVPPKADQRAGTPVYLPEIDPFQVDDETASLPMPEHAMPQPGLRPAGPANVAFMRGGLAKSPAEMPVAQPSAPAPAQTFSVRRTIKPTPPEPQRYSPLVEPELGVAPEAFVPQRRPGLSEESRRALQSALFELTECRRAIEKTISARGR